MLTSLKYGKELCSLSIQNLLSELIPHQMGMKRGTYGTMIWRPAKKTLHRSVTHSHALDSLLIG